MEFITDLFLRLFYYTIIGTVPYVVLVSLIAGIGKVEVNKIKARHGLIIMMIIGAIIAELIPNQPFYLH